MTTLAEVRQKYPQYADLDDATLGKALHAKYYADMPYEDFAQRVGLSAAPVAPVAPPKQRTAGEEGKRQAGLMGRMFLDTAAALPMAALEGGAGIANLANRAIGREGNVSFRGQYESARDQLFPQPEGAVENITQVAGNMLLGSKIPAPTAKATAPAAFQNAEQARKALTAGRVTEAQKAGYVIPPATSNPSATAKTAEGVAGKLSLAQQASAKNMANTDRLAAKALGLSEDAPITQAALRELRAEAGQPYEAVRGAGVIALGKPWKAALDKAESALKGANRSFEGFAKSDASGKIASLRKDFADSGDMVDAIRVLRDYADEAGAARNFKLARTYRNLAGELENSIERHLVANGQTGMVTKLRKARELIAKTYTVEKALNKGTEGVSATKIARQLDRGAPLTGELKQIGKFGLAFPKAAREFNESLPGISPLDFYAAGGTAALGAFASGGNPAAALPLAYPFVRLGTRNALLTPFGQKLAVPTQGGPIDPRYVMGGVNALAQ
jgi:hypothetical protein